MNVVMFKNKLLKQQRHVLDWLQTRDPHSVNVSMRAKRLQLIVESNWPFTLVHTTP